MVQRSDKKGFTVLSNCPTRSCSKSRNSCSNTNAVLRITRAYVVCYAGQRDFIGHERPVEVMKAGAYDFITRPFDPDHIELVARKAIERQTLKREVEVLSEENRDRYHMVIGESAKMKLAVEMARKAAASNSTVLLLGESGAGKELFARFIHNQSERANRPFIAINSVGLSKELLESDLFGHEQGAFTGAHKMKKGKIELANGGTIFLTRSAISRAKCKLSFCDSSKSGSSRGSVA